MVEVIHTLDTDILRVLVEGETVVSLNRVLIDCLDSNEKYSSCETLQNSNTFPLLNYEVSCLEVTFSLWISLMVVGYFGTKLHTKALVPILCGCVLQSKHMLILSAM